MCSVSVLAKSLYLKLCLLLIIKSLFSETKLTERLPLDSGNKKLDSLKVMRIALIILFFGYLTKKSEGQSE